MQMPWFTKKGPAKIWRAPRVRAEIPLEFREVGEFDWRIGTTQNISLSGVLFWADQAIKVGTPVELQYSPPAEANWTTGSQVSCRARIVRAHPKASSAEKPVCAAMIVIHDVWGKAGDL